MQIEKKKLLKGPDILSISEYRSKYGGGVSQQAIAYAMKNGLIDYTKIGRDRFVVMTVTTRSYKPNGNKNREKS